MRVKAMAATYHWEIIPLETPKVVKKCSRCTNNEFQSSDNFRVNSCKKVIDVWLIYKCTHCDFTWNMDILVRKNVTSIEPGMFKKFQENNRELAWYFAFNKNTLSNNKVQPNWDISFTFKRCIHEAEHDSNGLTVILTSEYELGISINKALQQMLFTSNTQIKRLIEKEYVIVNSDLKYRSNKVGAKCKIEMTHNAAQLIKMI